jgi:hypothetical protein
MCGRLPCLIQRREGLEVEFLDQANVFVDHPMYYRHRNSVRAKCRRSQSSPLGRIIRATSRRTYSAIHVVSDSSEGF